MPESIKILGIDPGTNITGFGLVEIRDKEPVILDMGKITPKKGMVHYERIKVLHEEALKLMINLKPDVMAIEAP
ncbi:MAG TPA: crossover junction endodeoxyribonuclease RuvC, partial [Draconibacterium sp.]|nr:crossover junction endodeoxyribonuclease RuvC [Draconibacterium sp.]